MHSFIGKLGMGFYFSVCEEGDILMCQGDCTVESGLEPATRQLYIKFAALFLAKKCRKRAAN